MLSPISSTATARLRSATRYFSSCPARCSSHAPPIGPSAVSTTVLPRQHMRSLGPPASHSGAVRRRRSPARPGRSCNTTRQSPSPILPAATHTAVGPCGQPMSTRTSGNRACPPSASSVKHAPASAVPGCQQPSSSQHVRPIGARPASVIRRTASSLTHTTLPSPSSTSRP